MSSALNRAPAAAAAAVEASLSSQVVPPFRPAGPGAKVLHESLQLKRRKEKEEGKERKKKEQGGER